MRALCVIGNTDTTEAPSASRSIARTDDDRQLGY
jgi:hypothetical protein